MTSSSRQFDGFTADDVREFEQEQREFDLGLDFAALIRRKPRNHKQKLIMEHLAKEKELKSLVKNKWMVLSPINDLTEYAIEAQFDTGAALNFITEGMAQLLGLEKEALDPPREFKTATGDSAECKYHVSANWRGQPGFHGRVEFFVLPEKSTVTKPLIGTDDKECWDELLDEQPKDVIYYTALSKPKAPERIESAALRTAVQNDQSQLRRKRESHEEKRGSSSSKSKGSRANDKKTKRN